MILEWLPAITALIVALGGVWGVRAQRQKAVTESSSLVVDSAVSAAQHLIDPLNRRIDQLEDELARLNKRIRALQVEKRDRESHIANLEVQIAGHEARIKVLEEWIRSQGVDPETIN